MENGTAGTVRNGRTRHMKKEMPGKQNGWGREELSESVCKKSNAWKTE